MVHLYSGILLSHKKEWNLVIFRDVDILPSKVNQKEKNKFYCILEHICRIYKNCRDEYVYKAEERHRHKVQTYGLFIFCVQKKGVGWIGIDICTLPCIKLITLRTYCISQGTLLNALWWSKWERNLKNREKRYVCVCIYVCVCVCVCVCVYGLFTLIYIAETNTSL